MTFVQATTGGGGWPMSVFLTPDLKPFFGGTYFPPDNRYGRPGFTRFLEYLAEAWHNDRGKIDESSAGVDATNYRSNEQAAPSASKRARQRYPRFGVLMYFRRTFDSRTWRIRRAPEISAPCRPELPAALLPSHAQRRSARHGAGTLREMASGRHVRSARRRLPSLFRRCPSGSCRISRKCCTIRPNSPSPISKRSRSRSDAASTPQIARGIFDYVLRDMTHPEAVSTRPKTPTA